MPACTSRTGWTASAPRPRSGRRPRPGARGDRPRRHPPRDRRARLRHAAEHPRRGKRAIEAGFTHYGPAIGHARRCARRSRPMRRARKGFPVDPSQVVVTPGGKPVMSYAITALIGTGDEAIIPDPGFPIYASMTRFVGGTPVSLPIRQADGFRFDTERLASLITPRTRLHRPQLAGQSHRRRADAGGDRAGRRARDRQRPGGPDRRDLRPHRVRGRAHLDRQPARDGRADDRPRRLLEGLRDDRLAARLRDRPAGRGRRLRAPRHQQRVLRVDVQPDRARPRRSPARRTRSTRWSASSAPGATSSSTA